MGKDNNETRKPYNEKTLSKRVSDIIGLHNGESLALHKALSELEDGPIKDAIASLCGMVEQAPVVPEYTFDVYKIQTDGTEKPLFAVTAGSRQEAKANAMACIKNIASEDSLRLKLTGAKLVTNVRWAVFENIFGETDLAHQWDIRDFECIGTFPDKASADACENEDLGTRVVKAV